MGASASWNPLYLSRPEQVLLYFYTIFSTIEHMYNIRQWKWLSNNQKQYVDTFIYYLSEIIILCRQLLKSVFEISSPHKRKVRKVHTFRIFISDECRTTIPSWLCKLNAFLYVTIKYQVTNIMSVQE